MPTKMILPSAAELQKQKRRAGFTGAAFQPGTNINGPAGLDRDPSDRAVGNWTMTMGIAAQPSARILKQQDVPAPQGLHARVNYGVSHLVLVAGTASLWET